MQLGQFARHHRRTRTPQNRHHIGECRGQPGAGFIEDECRGHGLQGFECGAPFAPLGRQKAREQEAVARQRRQHQPGQHGGGARHRMHRQIFGQGRARQLEARIGHQRGSRIADQRDTRPGPQFRQQARALAFPIVVVIGGERLREAVDRQQLGGDTGIFGRDQVAALQHIERAQCDITRMPDGRRGQIKPRPQFRLLHARWRGRLPERFTLWRCRHRLAHLMIWYGARIRQRRVWIRVR